MGEALPARQFWQLSVVSYRDYRVTRLRGGAFNFAHTEIKSAPLRKPISVSIDRSIARLIWNLWRFDAPVSFDASSRASLIANRR